MPTKKPITTFFLCIFFTLSLIGCQKDTQSLIYSQYSNYGFEDTLLNLDIAISEHNYRIIHRSNIGQAIRDRGYPDYPLSTITNFCNITYAKEMIEINADLINEMPCNVSVRESQQGVIVSTRLMAYNTANKEQNEFAQRINDNLKSIIQSTID